MNHQPFETWILAEEPLTAEQEYSLHTHLEVCEACSRLSAASSEVDQLLRSIPPIGPTVGFTTRWQARYAANRLQVYQIRQRRQSWWFFAMNAFGAFLVLILAVTQLDFSIDSPTTLLISAVRLATTWLSSVYAIQEILTTFSSIAVRIVPPIWWILITTGISLLSLIWLFSLRKLLFPRRIIL